MARERKAKLKDILDERTYRKARRRNRREVSLAHKRNQLQRKEADNAYA